MNPAERMIALKIQEMLAQRERGELRRSADDYISGMIAAYRILIGARSPAAALAAAKKVK